MNILCNRIIIAALMSLVIAEGALAASLQPHPQTEPAANEGKLNIPVPPEAYREAAEALNKAQPPSPAAAKVYKDSLEARKRSQAAQQGAPAVLEDIFKAAGQQGLNKETIQGFVNLNKEPDDYAGKHLLVFISSSLPQEMLKNLMAVLGGSSSTAFVLRGVVGNDVSKILPTQEWIRSFLCSDVKTGTECYRAPVDINPVLFERLHITHVPAIAYIPEPSTFLPSCEGQTPSEEDFLVYYGEFSPVHALEKFAAARPGDPVLQQLVTEITQKGFHQDARP